MKKLRNPIQFSKILGHIEKLVVYDKGNKKGVSSGNNWKGIQKVLGK